MTAPEFRSVCQFTGTIVEAAAVIDKLTSERDGAYAARDNMVDTAIELGRVANYLKHALAEVEHFRETAEDWRHKYESAQCRMDELAAEVQELRGAR